MDAMAMLTESPEARTYRRALKHRLEEKAVGWLQNAAN